MSKILFVVVLLVGMAAQAASVPVRSFNSIAELTSTPASGQGITVLLNGYTAANVYGEPAAYVHHPELSTTLHNPPTYIKEATSNGVWVASFVNSKEIPAEYFGVFPDGSDVTANLQKAADFCRISENTNSTPGQLDLSYGRTLRLGNKTTGAYTLNGTLYLNCNFDFSQAQIKASPLGTNVAIWVGPSATNQLAIWNLRGRFPAVMYSTNLAYSEGTAITVAAVENCLFEYGFIEHYNIGTKFVGNNAGNARNYHVNNFSNGNRHAWWLESFGASGFCNLNQYVNFSALATQVPAGGTNVLTGYEQLVMTTDGSLNGNVFIGGGIEGFASARFMVITNGTGNTFRDFRLESYASTIFTGQKPYWEVISTIGTSHGQDNHLYPATTVGMFAPPVRQTGNAAGNSSGGSRQFHFTQVDADKPAIYLEPTRYASVPLFTVYGMPTGTTGETNALSNPELYKLAMTPDVLGGKPASASSLRWYIENDVGTIRWRNTVSQQKMSINETQLAARVAGAADDHFTIGSQSARLSWLTNATETVGVVTYGDGTLQIAGTHPTIGSNNLAGLTITGDDRGTAVRSLMTYSHLVGDYVQTAFGSFPSNYSENATVRDWAGGYVVNSANSQNRGMRFSANATNQYIDLIVGPYGPTQIPQFRVTHEGVSLSNLTVNNYLNMPGMGWIDPRAYGARVDGVTDDTAAVQAAMTAAGNTMGVFFAPGTWRLANVTLSGTKYLLGQGATIKAITSGLTNSQSLFAVQSSAKVRIANLTFDMSDVTNRYAYGIGALVATNIDLQVENCAFTNFPASAILFSQASGKYAVRRSQFLNGRAHSGVTGEFSLGVTVSNGGGESTLLVEDSDFINTGSYSAGELPSGVLVSGGTLGCRAIIQRNYFYRVGTDSYGNLTAGVDLYQQAPNSIVQDNKFVACPFSIKTQEQSDVALLNNYLDGTGAVAGTTFGAVRGIYWTPAARNLYVPSPRGLRVIGNVIKNFTNSTAFLGSGDPTNATGGLFIVGNHIENVGRGIDMRYLSGVASFQDNVITNASQYGIALSGQTANSTNKVTISGGSVHVTGLYSLNLLDTPGDITVKDVLIRGNDGIYILSPGGSATILNNNIIATNGHGIAIIATNNVDARIVNNFSTVVDTSYRAVIARNLRSVTIDNNVATPRLEASTTSGTAMIVRLKNNQVTASDITSGSRNIVDVEAEQGTTTNLNELTANTMAIGSLDNTMAPRLVMFGTTNWGSEIRYGNTTNSVDARWTLRYVPSTDTFDIVSRDNSGGVYANLLSFGRLTSTARISATTTNTGDFTSLGNLTVGDSAQASRYIISDATNTSANGLRIKRSGIDRWVMRVDGTESGANAGGNLLFIRYDDAGSTLSTPLQITRSSGLVTLGGDLTIGGGITLGGVYRTTWPSGGGGATNGTDVWVEGVQQTTFNLQDGSEIAGAFSASNYTYSIVANSIATNKVDSTFRSFFLDRANHTGTQTASTISDFADTQWAAFTNSMVSSNNITFAYDTSNKKLMISSTGGGGGGGGGLGTNLFVNGILSQPAKLTNSATVTWSTNANGDIVATSVGGTYTNTTDQIWRTVAGVSFVSTNSGSTFTAIDDTKTVYSGAGTNLVISGSDLINQSVYFTLEFNPPRANTNYLVFGDFESSRGLGPATIFVNNGTDLSDGRKTNSVTFGIYGDVTGTFTQGGNRIRVWVVDPNTLISGDAITGLDASIITSGTFDVARMPSSVLLDSEAALLYGGLNNNNTWTGTQTFTNDVDFLGDVSFNMLTVGTFQSTTWTNLGDVTVGSNLVVNGSITLGGVTRTNWPTGGGSSITVNGSGTLTNIADGADITLATSGGTTATPTLTDTGVPNGTYTLSANGNTATVDAKGRITAIEDFDDVNDFDLVDEFVGPNSTYLFTATANGGASSAATSALMQTNVLGMRYISTTGSNQYPNLIASATLKNSGMNYAQLQMRFYIPELSTDANVWESYIGIFDAASSNTNRPVAGSWVTYNTNQGTANFYLVNGTNSTYSFVDTGIPAAAAEWHNWAVRLTPSNSIALYEGIPVATNSANYPTSTFLPAWGARVSRFFHTSSGTRYIYFDYGKIRFRSGPGR